MSARSLSLALALGLVAPGKALASAVKDRKLDGLEPPSEKQGRRRSVERRTGLVDSAARSPCGRHLVEIESGSVFVDGRRVQAGGAQILAAPIWRADGNAIAWMERRAGETRLVVVPEVCRPLEIIIWPLPRVLSADRPHWAASNKIVVGPEPLSPRAVATWE
jgi:hypothetical protein